MPTTPTHTRPLTGERVDFDLSDLAEYTAGLLGPTWHAERLTQDTARALDLDKRLTAIRDRADGFTVTFEPIPPDCWDDIDPLAMKACVWGDLATTSRLLLPSFDTTLAETAGQATAAIRDLRSRYPAGATFPADAAVTAPHHHQRAAATTIRAHLDEGPDTARTAHQLLDDAVAVAWAQRPAGLHALTFPQYRQLVRAAHFAALLARAFDLGHADHTGDLAAEINTALLLDPQLTR
ncbi:hypothetical protein [Kitasatospora sp. NPDC058478]|uniref:hypothetical protein n=1 Tax=unclassified Kitasatospora TaxID=2633591 RepID=UPI00365CF0CF